jgi:predicted RNA-binding Zn ribbon-like protein
MNLLLIHYTRFAENRQHRFIDVTIKIVFNSYMKEVHDHRMPNRAGSLHLLGGNLALNFANTESGRNGPQHLNHIHSAADIAIWARHAGIVDDATLERVSGEAPDGRAKLFSHGMTLREIIYQISSAVVTGGTPSPELIQTLASVHSRTLLSAQLMADDGKYSWRWQPGAEIGDEILGPIAEAAIGLLMHGDHKRIKQCQGLHCGWLFYDSSRNNSRQWCDMSVCGNRAKIRAFRKRREESEAPDGPS